MPAQEAIGLTGHRRRATPSLRALADLWHDDLQAAGDRPRQPRDVPYLPASEFRTLEPLRDAVTIDAKALSELLPRRSASSISRSSRSAKSSGKGGEKPPSCSFLFITLFSPSVRTRPSLPRRPRSYPTAGSCTAVLKCTAAPEHPCCLPANLRGWSCRWALHQMYSDRPSGQRPRRGSAPRPAGTGPIGGSRRTPPTPVLEPSQFERPPSTPAGAATPQT